jgi:hypothetical protein
MVSDRVLVIQLTVMGSRHRNDVGSPRARWCACLTDDDWRRQLADVTGAVARLDHGGVQW